MTVRWTVRAAEDRARSSRENRVPAKNVAEATPARILTALIPPPIKSPCTTNAYFVRGATASEFAIRRTTRRITQDIASQYARVRGQNLPTEILRGTEANESPVAHVAIYLYGIQSRD